MKEAAYRVGDLVMLPRDGAAYRVQAVQHNPHADLHIYRLVGAGGGSDWRRTGWYRDEDFTPYTGCPRCFDTRTTSDHGRGWPDNIRIIPCPDCAVSA